MLFMKVSTSGSLQQNMIEHGYLDSIVNQPALGHKRSILDKCGYIFGVFSFLISPCTTIAVWDCKLSSSSEGALVALLSWSLSGGGILQL